MRQQEAVVEVGGVFATNSQLYTTKRKRRGLLEIYVSWELGEDTPGEEWPTTRE